MKGLSGRWMVGLATGLVACLWAFSFCVRADEYASGSAAGSAAASSLRGELNSPGEINTKLAIPLTSDTPMQTFGADDEKQSFNAKLLSPSTHAFLEIFAIPSSTGDITQFMVKQDLDMDGSFDYMFDAPVPISGACINGFVSCSPGTWNGCKFYSWKVNASGQLYIVQLPNLGGLAGCYCINSSCGSNLVWNNMEYVLGTMGGGMIGIVQEWNPHIAVTNVSTTATNLLYYGLLTDEGEMVRSQDGIYMSGSTSPEQYYYSGVLPTDSETASQIADPDSPYSQISNSYSARTDPKEGRTCTIKRSVEFNASDTPYISIIESCSRIEQSLCEIQTEKICDYNGENCVVSYQNGNGTGLTPVSNSHSVESPNTSEVWIFNTDGNHITYQTTDQDGEPGTGTVQSGDSLWWHVERDYLCNIGEEYDFSAISRTHNVAQTAELVGDTLYYQDGGLQYSVLLQDSLEEEGCEQMCKVAVTREQNNLGMDAKEWELQQSSTTTEYIFKQCFNSVCEIEPGEVIVQNCTCMNNFVQAASIMQTMEEAGNDIICSSD